MSAQPSSGPTFWDAPSALPDAQWLEKRRLAQALRELCALCVTTDAPEAALTEAADAVEGLVARLGVHPTRTFKQGVFECKSHDDVARFADRSTLSGLSNPIAPPMAFAMEGEMGTASVTFGPAYEGVPGCVHGGLIAAAFDQMFGFVQVKLGINALTGELKVRYKRPTPIQTPLRMEANVVRVAGRTSTVTSRMLAGETVTAEAEGVFVLVDPTQLREIIAGKNG